MTLFKHIPFKIVETTVGLTNAKSSEDNRITASRWLMWHSHWTGCVWMTLFYILLIRKITAYTACWKNHALAQKTFYLENRYFPAVSTETPAHIICLVIQFSYQKVWDVVDHTNERYMELNCSLYNCIYTVSYKTVPFYFGHLDHNSHCLVDFYTSCTNWNRNEYSTEKLKDIQLYPVSTHYLAKLKTHKTAHFDVNYHVILLLNNKNEAMSYVSYIFYKSPVLVRKFLL